MKTITIKNLDDTDVDTIMNLFDGKVTSLLNSISNEYAKGEKERSLDDIRYSKGYIKYINELKSKVKVRKQMPCKNCGADDLVPEYSTPSEDPEGIRTNYVCPECGTLYGCSKANYFIIGEL